MHLPFFHSHHPEHINTETHHVSVGHLFVLKCRLVQTNVTWRREGTHDQSLPPGVESREALLLFQPVQMSHNGSYTCTFSEAEKRYRNIDWLRDLSFVRLVLYHIYFKKHIFVDKKRQNILYVNRFTFAYFYFLLKENLLACKPLYTLI